ncbi:dihydroxyacetone kinase subunit DhaK [Pseudomonas sp. CGJS7]|uniref:dihydroxyacetone kinase subunit DhaK n=1 Tax=Pseudomonas sp. CGJS7 TaxID=3109348 RepID=UPI0030084C75
MDRFFNRPADVVTQILNSTAASAAVDMADPRSGLRILVRTELDRSRVAVLSGGGAGHEPAHAGFVGRGMLSAAISGEIFASPSVAAVLAGIRHCTGSGGALLIVKNYTGDRLNFGLAAEQARREGLQVRMCIVADDIALGDSARPRGIAGTVLVHKYAGYLAGQGVGLDELADRCQVFAERVSSLGLSLSSCTLPGHVPEPRGAELGLGIHNEPGARRIEPINAADAVQQVLTPLLERGMQRYGSSQRWIVMLNDLGGCSTQELAVLTDEVLCRIGRERIALMVRPAALMTSLDMHGFSLTLVPAESGYVRALSMPVEPLAWPGVYVPRAPGILAMNASAVDRPVGAQDAANAAAIERLMHVLLDSEKTLDELDARIGDGDAGSTFAAGARAVLEKLQRQSLSTGEPARLCDELGALLAHAMGGSSGVLLSILFTATGTALTAGRDWQQALNEGIVRMQHYGGARSGDRTMLDALIPAVDVLGEGLAASARAARLGADRTASMTRAGAGRASYVPEHALSGAIDPGAEAVARAFASLAAA